MNNSMSRSSMTALQHPRTQVLLVSAGILTSIKFATIGSYFSSAGILSSLAMLYPHSTWDMYAKLNLFCKRRRWSTPTLLGLMGGFIAAWMILGGWVDPAHAQFFSGAETWMKGSFKGIDPTALALVFNVLRGLIILYLGINLVKVVQAAREGDDWQTLARTPLIIVVTVTMGDLLVKMIIGGGSGGGTAGA